jgi:hypothetical protein
LKKEKKKLSLDKIESWGSFSFVVKVVEGGHWSLVETPS